MEHDVETMRSWPLEALWRVAYPAVEPRVGTEASQRYQAAKNELARRTFAALTTTAP